MNNDEENKGDGAPLNAPKTEDQSDLNHDEQGNEMENTDEASQSCQENTSEEQQNSVDQPEGATECSQAEPNAEEPGSDDNLEEHGSESGTEDKLEGASQSSQKADSNNPKETRKNGTDDETKKKPNDRASGFKRLSGAARKRYRHFITLGLSEEEAREKALIPFGRSNEKPRTSQLRKPLPMKVCVVHSNFPDDLLTTEQIKSVQEAITDKILEITGHETKPKFSNLIFSEGWLTLTCADIETAKWIREVAPTLKPWEGASLKAKYQHDMPQPETYVAFFPESHDYSDDKILKLIIAQNDRFNVTKWKIIKKVPVGTEAEVTFSIDRKYSGLLKKADLKVNYKFGQVQLWPKKDDSSKKTNPKVEPNGSAKGNQQPKGEGPPKRKWNGRREFRRPARKNVRRPDRNRYRWGRGSPPRSSSRDSHEPSRRNVQSSRREAYRDSPPRSAWNYSSEPSSSKRSRDEDYRDSQRFKAPRTSWEDSRSSQVWAQNDELQEGTPSYNQNFSTWVAEPWKPWKKY